VDKSMYDSSDTFKASGRLLDREDLLNEIHYITTKKDVIVVINIADTKKYEDCIRVFGYKFADDILTIRSQDMHRVDPTAKFYHVGFWSIAFIISTSEIETYELYLEKFVSILNEPIICRGIPIPVHAGIGVFNIQKGLGASEDFLQAAFLASQESIHSNLKWKLCTDDADETHRRAFSMIVDLGEAIDNMTGFELYYQGRANLQTGVWSGAEAFLRWNHPVLGLVMAQELIPLIEIAGLIRKTTDFVLRTAIKQGADWHQTGTPLTISISVSPRNLEQTGFIDHIADLLAFYKLPASLLELEFSENSFYSNHESAKHKLIKLRELGVNVAIVDFGTSTDTLKYLETTPANVFKIDRRILISMKDNFRNQKLVKSMISLAHEINMDVSAKGVEDTQMMDLLKGWKCDYMNGYLFHKPMNVSDFSNWCSTESRRTVDQVLGRRSEF
jgi:EAL domain-containing protein (putative c-di-GMP-specific phosphodiesterase class I)